MANVIECAEGRYEVQDVEFGRVYKWRPERVVVECDCGERTALRACVNRRVAYVSRNVEKAVESL